jgi:hypothetical protein
MLMLGIELLYPYFVRIATCFSHVWLPIFPSLCISSFCSLFIYCLLSFFLSFSLSFFLPSFLFSFFLSFFLCFFLSFLFLSLSFFFLSSSFLPTFYNLIFILPSFSFYPVLFRMFPYFHHFVFWRKYVCLSLPLSFISYKQDSCVRVHFHPSTCPFMRLVDTDTAVRYWCIITCNVVALRNTSIDPVLFWIQSTPCSLTSVPFEQLER